MNTHQESTYALLVRSEEKSRNGLETVLYSTCILSVVIAIWQFAHQPVHIPAAGIDPNLVTAAEVVSQCPGC
jgi:hypothetical protein